LIVKNACTTLCTVYTKMVFTGRNNDVGYLMRIFASQELQSKYYHLHMWGEVECKPLLAKMSTALAQSGKKISMTRFHLSNWWVHLRLLVGSVLVLFLVFCAVLCFLCFVCLCLVCCVVHCGQCLWIVNPWLPLRFSLNGYLRFMSV
jgi:hypothetical protein